MSRTVTVTSLSSRLRASADSLHSSSSVQRGGEECSTARASGPASGCPALDFQAQAPAEATIEPPEPRAVHSRVADCGGLTRADALKTAPTIYPVPQKSATLTTASTPRRLLSKGGRRRIFYKVAFVQDGSRSFV